MSKKLLNLVSFHERFFRASLIYLGLGMLLLAMTPGVPKATAAAGCGNCPEGQVCTDIGEEQWECRCPE